MNMKKRILDTIKIIVSVTAFACLIFISTVFCTELLREKRGDVLDFGEYKAEQEDSIDVLFLGSSHVFMDILPVTIWEKSGITSYNITSSAQVPAISYYYLEEALKTQSPKVVAFDVFMIDSQYPDEWRARLAMGAMPWSLTKVNAIKNAIPEDFQQLCRNELFGYHNNWSHLKEYDYEYALTKLFHADKVSFLKGSEVYLVKVSNTNQSWYYQPVYEMPNEEIYAYNLEYIKKIAQTVEDAGAELLLLSTPCPNAGRMEYYLERVAEDLEAAGFSGFAVYDMNDDRNEMQFDYSKDMTDGVHCNTTGANKVSCQIAKYLNEHYEFPDRRSDAVLAETWDALVPRLAEYVDNGVYRPWTQGAVVQ